MTGGSEEKPDGPPPPDGRLVLSHEDFETEETPGPPDWSDSYSQPAPVPPPERQQQPTEVMRAPPVPSPAPAAPLVQTPLRPPPAAPLPAISGGSRRTVPIGASSGYSSGAAGGFGIFLIWIGSLGMGTVAVRTMADILEYSGNGDELTTGLFGAGILAVVVLSILCVAAVASHSKTVDNWVVAVALLVGGLISAATLNAINWQSGLDYFGDFLISGTVGLMLIALGLLFLLAGIAGGSQRAIAADSNLFRQSPSPVPRSAPQPVPVQTQAPAGWQPDPNNPAQYRYWNGQAWTDDYAPRPAWER